LNRRNYSTHLILYYRKKAKSEKRPMLERRIKLGVVCDEAPVTRTGPLLVVGIGMGLVVGAVATDGVVDSSVLNSVEGSLVDLTVEEVEGLKVLLEIVIEIGTGSALVFAGPCAVTIGVPEIDESATV
jgi:hypothetical protein